MPTSCPPLRRYVAVIRWLFLCAAAGASVTSSLNCSQPSAGDRGGTGGTSESAASARDLDLGAIGRSVYRLTGERIRPGGFDPGMTIARAKVVRPDLPGHRPFMICAPGASCPAEAPNEPFYTVATDRIGGELAANAIGPSGASFGWSLAGNTPTSQALTGVVQLTNIGPGQNWRDPAQNIAAPYVGLQINAPNGGGGYAAAGSVRMSSIRYIHFRLRASACVLNGESVHGRILYYLSMRNTAAEAAKIGRAASDPFSRQPPLRPNGTAGLEVAVNLLRFMVTPDGRWGNGGVAEPGRARWECSEMNEWAHPTCGTSVVDLDGPTWDVSRENELAVRSANPGGCTTDAVPGQPFFDYVVDVPVLLTRLVEEGFVTREYLKTADYVGGNLGGVEFFGPAAVRSEIQSHAVYVVDGAPNDLDSVIDAARGGLLAANPGFLGGANQLTYREVKPSVEACSGGVQLGARCNLPGSAPGSLYGAICAQGTSLLTCGNGKDGITMEWYKSGDNISCSPEQAPGRACTMNSQTTCRWGAGLMACTTPRYRGPGYPVQTTSSPPTPASPSPNPSSSPNPSPTGGSYETLPAGYYKLASSGAQFKVRPDRRWCWYNMKYSDANTLAAPTAVVPPGSARVAGRDGSGRCEWDVLAGAFVVDGVPPLGGSPNGSKYYYDGAGAWCWFVNLPQNGDLPPKWSYTTRMPQTLGDFSASWADPDGRCKADPR